MTKHEAGIAEQIARSDRSATEPLAQPFLSRSPGFGGSVSDGGLTLIVKP